MDHGIDPVVCECRRHALAVPEIALDQFGTVHCRTMTAAEIVDDDGIVPRLSQQAGDDAPHVARPTGHQKSHSASS
jgi:hypothetical protein